MAATEPVTPRMSRAIADLPFDWAVVPENASPRGAMTLHDSLPLDVERLQGFREGLRQVVPERALELLPLPLREEHALAGPLGERIDDHLEVGCDDSGEIFERVG